VATTHKATEFVVGAVVAGATVLPAFLGFAEPMRRGAAAMFWMKTITNVLVCGALLALSQWIFTLYTNQWTQTGLPVIPLIDAKPGGGPLPAGGASRGNLGVAQATTSHKTQASWLGDEYRD